MLELKVPLPFIEEDKKHWPQVESNLVPLDNETIVLTTLPPLLSKIDEGEIVCTYLELF